MRSAAMVAILTVALAGTALAQCGMPMQSSPMASMMGAMETAAWGGKVYVLQGNMLQKRDLQGNVLAAVELEDFEQTMMEMEEADICPMCGMDMEMMEEMGGCPMMGGGMMQGQQGGGMMHGQQGGGMMGGGGMMQGGGQGMMMGGSCPMMGAATTEPAMAAGQLRQMYSCVRLTADAEGVYVLRGGKMTVFSHDLQKKAAWDVNLEDCPANERMRATARRHMMATNCPHCRMHTGAGAERVQRAIPMGSVEIWHHPRMLAAGRARLHVQVFDASKMPDRTAQVSGFLYPAGNTAAGIGLTMMPLGEGQFYALVDIPRAGSWELAVRVMRPGMDDARAYYGIAVQ